MSLIEDWNKTRHHDIKISKIDDDSEEPQQIFIDLVQVPKGLKVIKDEEEEQEQEVPLIVDQFPEVERVQAVVPEVHEQGVLQRMFNAMHRGLANMGYTFSKWFS